MTDDVRSLFELAGAEKAIPIVPTIVQARAYLLASGSPPSGDAGAIGHGDPGLTLLP
jgi:hypothetical protein